MQVVVLLGQRREMVVQVEVALGADAEIEVDVLRQRLLQRPLDDRLDRRHARAAGDGDDRPAMALAQIGGAERPLDADAVADLELARDMRAGGAARGAPDMELEHRIARHVGHGIVARRAALEGHRGELAGREVERAARGDLQANALDVVRGVVEPDDLAVEQAARMDDQVVLLQPGDLAVLPRHGAAGEDQAARLLLVGQRELGIALHRHLALHEVRLAGAAIARLAAERIADAGIERGRQDGGAGRHVDGAVGLGDADFEAHGR